MLHKTLRDKLVAWFDLSRPADVLRLVRIMVGWFGFIGLVLFGHLLQPLVVDVCLIFIVLQWVVLDEVGAYVYWRRRLRAERELNAARKRWLGVNTRKF
jgi:hypothetical protein